MARRRYLVTYDVADDKRRDRVFRVLGDNGEHLQFSVFMCELNERELVAMKAAVNEVLHEREDQVLLVDLGLAEQDVEARVESMGRAFVVAERVVVV